MKLLRIATVVLWILCAASFLLPNTPAAGWGRAVFWILLAAHAVEFAVFQRMLRAAPGGLGYHLPRTLIFGMFHIREVQSRETPAPTSADPG